MHPLNALLRSAGSCLLLAAAALGQPPGPKLPDRIAGNLQRLPRNRSIRVDVNVVMVPVTVTDRRGRVVSGLERESFTVLEDGVPQSVVSFSKEDAPVSLGLLIDLSGSMTQKMAKTSSAIGAFLRNVNSTDEAFLMTFSDRPEIRVDFTADMDRIERALLFARPAGRTALIDVVYLALRHMRSAGNPRKALLIISDGGDNNSRYTERELRLMARETDVRIHAIGIHDNPMAAEEMRGPWLLEDLARETGGRHFTIRDISELSGVAAKLGLALHDQYVLGYHPPASSAPGKWRKIRIKLSPPEGFPPLQVYARNGYYAAGQ